MLDVINELEKLIEYIRKEHSVSREKAISIIHRAILKL